MDKILHWPLAIAVFMACTLSLLLAFVLAYRLAYLFRHTRHLRRAPEPIPDSDMHVFMGSLAVGFVAISIVFFIVIARNERWISWSGFGTDLGYLATIIAYLGSCLTSVHALTRASVGMRYVLTWGGISLVVALIARAITLL